MSKKLLAISSSVLGSLALLVVLLSTAVYSPPLVEASHHASPTAHARDGDTSLVWDDLDSHRWIGADWGMTDLPSSLTWGEFFTCTCLEVRWDYPAWLGYIHTDKFPSENWEAPVIGLRATVYVESSQSWTDIRLEPQNNLGVSIESLSGNAMNLTPGQWHTLTWLFTESADYQQVTGLIFAIDQLGNDEAAVYFADLRLLRIDGSELWDDMQDGSRNWFYGGNWFNWANRDYGIEPVTHNGVNPTTPPGSVFLQWDYENGEYPGLTVAEIGTDNLDDLSDWSGFNRLSADVKVSDPDVYISLFLWDEDANSGFGTPAKRTAVADEWRTLTWDLPWPAGFDSSDIDQVKFIVNGLDTHLTGTLYLDNITLNYSSQPPAASGAVSVLDSFDDQDASRNDFNASKGVLLGQHITPTFDTTVFTGTAGASLQINYSLPPTLTFTGLWQSLWGDINSSHRYLDFSRGIRQIRFWVRGSGQTSRIYNVRVELKDISSDFDHTAYRYIQIDDNDTTWQEIVLDADVTNAAFWSYNLLPPDPTQMKQLVFVIENAFNDNQGLFYLDHIHFIVDEPTAVNGLGYILENFDDRSAEYNDFSGNWGALNGDFITTTFATDAQPGNLALALNYSFPPTPTFTGMWHSLWGHSDFTTTQSLDLTDFYGALNEPDEDIEQIQFWLRGSGQTTQTHIIKIELKDVSNDFYRTAYRYVILQDGNTDWQQIVLDADLTNASFWSYNGVPPDNTALKQMVFVLESDLNDPTGTFYVDDIRFVDADQSPVDPAQLTDEQFLDLVSQKTFLYFLDWYNPYTGLYQDRSTFPDLMSTAATGFGLTALVIGAERGWISQTLAVEMISRTLTSLYEGHAVTATITDTISGTNGYKGFYYHFLGTNGMRSDANSELSSVDTAILQAGILTVREYFADEPGLVALADALYERVEWDWMLDPASNQFYLAWQPLCRPDYMVAAPGGGCFNSHVVTNTQGITTHVPWLWDYYTDEVMLINLLAIGSPSHPVATDTFYAWVRNQGTYGDQTLFHSWNGSFFTYIFAHLWLDFAILGSDNHPTPTLQVDWWANSLAAAQANWQFAVDHQDDQACDGDDHYTTYGPLSWGLTAADAPDGYHAYGAAPTDPRTMPEHDGTIAPYGAGSGIMFLPVTATQTLRHYFSNTDLWRYRFGFADAYNLDPTDCQGAWTNHVGFGIDQGPLLLALENHRSRFVWDTFMQNESIRRAVCAVWCDLVISGPDAGWAGVPIVFTATLTPALDLAQPVTYTWQTVGQSPIVQTGGHTSTVVLVWNEAGPQVITVTAVSEAGAFVSSHTITISIPETKVYLPILLKQH